MLGSIYDMIRFKNEFPTQAIERCRRRSAGISTVLQTVSQYPVRDYVCARVPRLGVCICLCAHLTCFPLADLIQETQMQNSRFHYNTAAVFSPHYCHFVTEYRNKKGNWEKHAVQTLAFILCHLPHEVYDQIPGQTTFICPHTVHVVKHLCCEF